MNKKGLRIASGFTLIALILVLSVYIIININQSYSKVIRTETFNGTMSFNTVISPKWFSIGGHYELNDYVPTSDGGWIYAGRPDYSAYTSEIYKYDKNGVLQWTKTFQIDGEASIYIYKYTDGAKPNKTETNPGSHPIAAAQIIQTSDGNYAVSTRSAGMFAKLDNEGNIIWQNEDYWYKNYYEYDEVCTYEGNTNEQGQVLFSYDHGTKNYSDLSDDWKRDNTTYYCNRSTISSYYFDTLGTRLAPLKDGKILSIVDIYGSNYISDEGELTPLTSGMQFMVYDEDGNLETIKSVNEKVNTAYNAYKTKYGITDSTNPTVQDYHWYLNSYGDNSFLLVMSETAIKLKYNPTTRDFDIIWYTPLGYNGYAIPSLYSNNDGILNIQLTEDGGFTFASDYMYSLNDSVKNTGLYSGSNLRYNVDVAPGYNHVRSGNYIWRFEEKTETNGTKQAYLVDAQMVMSTERDAYYMKDGSDDFNYIYNYASDTRGITYVYLPDGSYIVASKYNWSYGNRTQSANESQGIEEDLNFGRKIILADGTTHLITTGTNLIVFRINKDGRVTWIKEYTGGASGMSDTRLIINKSRLSIDKKQIAMPITMYPGSPLMEFKDAQAAPETLYTRDTTGTYHSFLIYDLNYDTHEEIIPDPTKPTTQETTADTTSSTTNSTKKQGTTKKKTTKKTEETTTTEEATTEETSTTTSTNKRKTTITTASGEVKGDDTNNKGNFKKIITIIGIVICGLFVGGVGFYFIPIILGGGRKVLIGLSGNADSAVAAKLLLDKNYKVSALFINNGTNVGELTLAKQISNKLGIDLYEQDINESYKSNIKQGIANHLGADLDNIYNKYILIDMLKEVAKEQHIGKIAIGVYAKKQGGNIIPGANQVFDESAKLSLLTDEDIKKLVLPLGEIDYQEVSKIAEQNGLNLSNKKQTAEEKIGINNL